MFLLLVMMRISCFCGFLSLWSWSFGVLIWCSTLSTAPTCSTGVTTTPVRYSTSSTAQYSTSTFFPYRTGAVHCALYSMYSYLHIVRYLVCMVSTVLYRTARHLLCNLRCRCHNRARHLLAIARRNYALFQTPLT